MPLFPAERRRRAGGFTESESACQGTSNGRAGPTKTCVALVTWAAYHTRVFCRRRVDAGQGRVHTRPAWLEAGVCGFSRWRRGSGPLLTGVNTKFSGRKGPSWCPVQEKRKGACAVLGWSLLATPVQVGVTFASCRCVRTKRRGSERQAAYDTTITWWL